MLTKKQKELFDYLDLYMIKTGISPSFEEMKLALNLKSKSGIHRLITSLEQRGFIKRLKHRARAMQIIKKPQDLISNNSIYNNKEHSIPIMGTISAGNPIEGILTEKENINVPSHMISKNHQHFALNIKGESMIGDGIMDGDIAVIKHTNVVNSGKIAAVLVKDEDVTLKRIKVENARITLVSSNPLFNDKEYSPQDIIIQGELKGIIRKYN